jgi:hypothetical protein
MLRATTSKVMWVGRATVFLVGLAVILALVFGVASRALGANGDSWRLGKNNVATAITALGGAAGVNGPMVRLTNNNAGTDDTALNLKVQSGEAPMSVNSDTQVANLNADLLDGQHSSNFVHSSTYRNETALGPGVDQGDGTFVQLVSCDAGDVLLSGGPANVNATSDMVESFPNNGGGWSARINKHGVADNFSVVALCANQ